MIQLDFTAERIEMGPRESTYGTQTQPRQDFEHCYNSLCISARVGSKTAVIRILQIGSPSFRKALLETPSGIHNWTPLFFACVEGHLHIVQVLLDAGAVQSKCDRNGWTEKEHAVFRGHMRIAELLTSHVSGAPYIAKLEVVRHGMIRAGDLLDTTTGASQQRADRLTVAELSSNVYDLNPERSHIFLTMGPANTRSSNGVFDPLPDESSHDISSTSNRSLSLSVRAPGATVHSSGEFELVGRLGTTLNRPMHLSFNNLASVIIYFDLQVNHEMGGSRNGTAVAIIGMLRHKLGLNNESLCRDYTIPVIDPVSLICFGTLTFHYLLVTPFLPQREVRVNSNGFWNTLGTTSVVGHRGSGANSTARTHLQIAENTVQSFLAAADLGATCVEFDVQLTKDYRSVIFHDFIVAEMGGEVPLHTLSLDQFMHLSHSQTPTSSIVDTAENRYRVRRGNTEVVLRKQRSQSLNAFDEQRIEDVVARIKLTDEGKEGDVKGNLRGFSIQQPATTLEQLLKELPEDLPFNLEIKYPMLWEAEDRGMEPYAIEINFFVNKILAIIFDLRGRRNITLSSFSPEICILLACKQKTFPVLFINKAGMVPAGDERAGSLKGAIEFAKAWNLAGIVMVSDPFVMCPRLLGYAVDSGLVVGSYGPLNDDPECAKVCPSYMAGFPTQECGRLIRCFFDSCKPNLACTPS